MEKGRRERTAVIALVLENDLGERHRRQVFAGGGVHDRDLLAVADHLLDFFEGDVAALLRVVELPIGVPLDDVRHGRPLRDVTMTPLTLRVKPGGRADATLPLLTSRRTS